MNLPLPPAFPGFQQPRSDFSAVRGHLRTQPFKYVIDLSTAHSFAAGTQLVLQLQGNIIYFDQAPNSGIATIRFEDITAGAAPITVYPGAAFRVPFTQICVENAAQPNLSLTIIYGVDIDFFPAFSAGVSILAPVSIVDGGKATTLAKYAFGTNIECPASVGNYSHVQLYNPAGSGTRVIVKAVELSIGNATALAAINCRSFSTALANLYGAAGGHVGSKLNDGTGLPQSTAEVRYENSASILGGIIFQSRKYSAGPAIIQWQRFTEPYIMVPGKGMLWGVEVFNCLLSANVEWTEEPNV